MTYIAGHDRSQTQLLPESLNDYVGPENSVRFIKAFVDGLDMIAAGFGRATPKVTGRPGYAPNRPSEALHLRLSESHSIQPSARG
jgi:transposase